MSNLLQSGIIFCTTCKTCIAFQQLENNTCIRKCSNEECSREYPLEKNTLI